MRVTLKTIADATGFSVNTVSRVLRDDPKISSSTSNIIRAKAEELGYVPDAVASSLRKPRSMTIGIVSADSSNSFFSEVIHGIDEKAQELGYNILIGNTGEDVEKEEHLIRLFLSRKVDGLIIMPTYVTSPDHLSFYSSLSVPFIFAGRYIEGFRNHSLLHSDTIGEEAVFEYLLSSGHRKILYLSGPGRISNTIDRDLGRQRAYEAFSVTSDPKYVYHLEGHTEDGYKAVNEALNRSLQFSAIVCFNDIIAMGALKSLAENDIPVPEEVEVIGFDNIMFSQFMQPALSTVDVPKYQLGAIAMETLHKHIEDSALVFTAENLPARLVLRDSTKKRKYSQFKEKEKIK